MGWESIAALFIPAVVQIIKDAGNEDYEVAKGILLGVFGTSLDNKILVEQAMARIKLQKLLDEQK